MCVCVHLMSLAPGLTKLYLIASPAPCCENPAAVVCARCECRPEQKYLVRFDFFSWFLSFAYHLVIIVEAEEALEVLPICLNYIM